MRPARWITVSCGVCSCVPGGDGQRSDLIAAADEALYKAKRTGRNRTVFQSLVATMEDEMMAALEFAVHEGTEPLPWASTAEG